MTVLDETGLNEFIDAHYRGRGDVLWRMERLPLYDVPQQAAEQLAWREGRQPDEAPLRAWLDILADERRRGLLTRRVRVLSERLSEDELRACHWSYPQTGRFEVIRILHRGEHPAAETVDHDYWLITPRDRAEQVVRMEYDASGAFLRAVVVPAAEHEPYAAEMRHAWAVAEPFDTWWPRHMELHRRVA